MAISNTDYRNITISLSDLWEIKEALIEKIDYLNLYTGLGNGEDKSRFEVYMLKEKQRLKDIRDYLQECIDNPSDLKVCQECKRIYDPKDSEADRKDLFCCIACEMGVLDVR